MYFSVNIQQLFYENDKIYGKKIQVTKNYEIEIVRINILYEFCLHQIELQQSNTGYNCKVTTFISVKISDNLYLFGLIVNSKFCFFTAAADNCCFCIFSDTNVSIRCISLVLEGT